MTKKLVVECQSEDVVLPCGSLQVDEGILYIYRQPDNVDLIATFNAFEWKKTRWQE